MKRPRDIAHQISQIRDIDAIAQTFKGIASINIGRIRSKVVSSQDFFGEIWTMYSQLRSNPEERITRTNELAQSQKRLFVVISSQGGLSGDIDDKLVEFVMREYSAGETDIVVLGQHGALLLAQRKVDIVQYFALPSGVDEELDAGPVVEVIRRYASATLFYQKYVTLSVQDIARIDLINAVRTLSEDVSASSSEIISSHNYIIEPTVGKVVQHMEDIMLGIALNQTILESKLAQYASRFNAMSQAHDRAEDQAMALRLNYHRSLRGESDERTREIVHAYKMVRNYGR